MFSLSSRDGDGVADTLTARSAASASSRCGCSTAIRSPSRITRTPGSRSAADVSTAVMMAPWAGGRTMRACSASGGTTSPAYFAPPVTVASASRRRTDDCEVGDALDRGLALEPALDPLAGGQLTVGHVLGRVLARHDHAVFHF